MRKTKVASRMKKPGNFNFKVGQLAETRSFEEGYRGAWFRCKIKEIQLKKNMILGEYYDFEDNGGSAEESWEKIYQVPPYGIKLRHITQLMVRPQYPAMYHKSKVPAVTEDECMVVYDGKWKVDDIVDWFTDGCYWSARVVKVLSDDKYQVELPLPPAGQGEPGENGKHIVSSKDLRPFLEWSEAQGWTLLTEEGRPSCDAQLICPTKQATDMEVEHAEAVGSPVNENKMYTHELGTDMEVEHAEAVGSPVNGNKMCTYKLGTDMEVEHAEVVGTYELGTDKEVARMEAAASPVNAVEHMEAAASPVNASSTTRISGGGDSQKNGKRKTNGDLVESSSQSTSSLSVEKVKETAAAEEEDGYRELNIMREETLEAAVLDLEELVCKVEWMQAILQSGTTSSSSWKFI